MSIQTENSMQSQNLRIKELLNEYNTKVSINNSQYIIEIQSHNKTITEKASIKDDINRFSLLICNKYNIPFILIKESLEKLTQGSKLEKIENEKINNLPVKRDSVGSINNSISTTNMSRQVTTNQFFNPSSNFEDENYEKVNTVLKKENLKILKTPENIRKNYSSVKQPLISQMIIKSEKPVKQKNLITKLNFNDKNQTIFSSRNENNLSYFAKIERRSKKNLSKEEKSENIKNILESRRRDSRSNPKIKNYQENRDNFSITSLKQTFLRTEGQLETIDNNNTSVFSNKIYSGNGIPVIKTAESMGSETKSKIKDLTLYKHRNSAQLSKKNLQKAFVFNETDTKELKKNLNQSKTKYNPNIYQKVLGNKTTSVNVKGVVTRNNQIPQK